MQHNPHYYLRNLVEQILKFQNLKVNKDKEKDPKRDVFRTVT